MPADRAAAIGRARSVFDDGGFVERLTGVVAYPTGSQIAARHMSCIAIARTALVRCCGCAGFETRVYENSRDEFGLVLIALDPVNVQTVSTSSRWPFGSLK